MVYGRRGTTTAVAATDTPILDFGGAATPYSDYACLEQLLTLQRPRTDHAVEMSFVVTTQVMELIFKLLRHEWEEARRLIRCDDVRGALAVLRRANHHFEVLNASWQMLITLTPTEFNSFRDALGEASGFQSYLYRHLEFLVGNKSASLVRPHRDTPGAFEELQAALAAPSLYDEVLALLARRGFAVPDSALDRDFTLPYTPSDDVEKVWVAVYADDRSDNELLELAEVLLDLAERFTTWRQRHLNSVKRAMGTKPGTGGSAGVEWLARIVSQDVFADLWSSRTAM